MKYILTEDTPWGKKGEEHNTESSGSVKIKHEKYAGLITPVEIFILKKLGVLKEVREDGKWVPEKGDYYFTPEANRVATHIWDNDNYDKWMLVTGMAFKTYGEALAYRDAKLAEIV